MKSEWRSAAVRIVALLAVVLGIVFLVVQTINRPVSGEVHTYNATFGNVFGLRNNADVRIKGVQVGKVTKLEIVDDSKAKVTFTVQDDWKLTAADTLSIKFQSIAGQRYLSLAPSGDPAAAPIRPGGSVPKAIDSFDITTLFNGLAPVLDKTDPAVYNRLALNVSNLLDGTVQDPGVLLQDVATLTKYSNDRAATLKTVVGNLDQITAGIVGRSDNVVLVMNVFGGAFSTFQTKMDTLMRLIDNGSIEFSNIQRIVESLSVIGLGGTDKFTERIYEMLPDLSGAAKALALVPPMMDGLQNLLAPTGLKCSGGVAELTATAQLLVAGRAVSLCQA